jgi:hypothetical protein
MRIIITKEGYVDLEAPINMTDKQIEKFVSFMKSLFPYIETLEVNEPIKEFPIGTGDKKHWNNIDELSLLLGPDDNDTIASKTGRNEMSVRMKRGDFVKEFMAWAKKKGYSYSPKSVEKEVVKEFLQEASIK